MLAEVYDLESLSNLFTYTGYCRTENKYYQFVIHKSINDYNKLIDHLKRDKLMMIGFNNENYDYPIIHHLLNHISEYSSMDGEQLARNIYSKSQSLINSEFNTIADKNKFIMQIDLYKIWHYDNKARHTSWT